VQYPQDGGVSAVRFQLRDRGHPLARAAADAITVRYHDTGYIICQCRFDGFWSLGFTERWAVLTCCCNGSSLPLYIGPPPAIDADGDRATSTPCPCGSRFHGAAIAIGYPRPTPPLGGIEAERAQEIAVALHCTQCHTEYIGWHLRLPEPRPVSADDPWLRNIQGRFRR